MSSKTWQICCSENINRRVSFSETSEMVLMLDLSKSPHRRAIWFSGDELEGFSANARGHVSLVRMQIARREAPAVDEILGLEKLLTDRLAEEYRIRRARYFAAVLREARQEARPRSQDDADQLARVCAERSAWSLERARAAALLLENDQVNGGRGSSGRHFKGGAAAGEQAIEDCDPITLGRRLDPKARAQT